MEEDGRSDREAGFKCEAVNERERLIARYSAVV